MICAQRRDLSRASLRSLSPRLFSQIEKKRLAGRKGFFPSVRAAIEMRHFDIQRASNPNILTFSLSSLSETDAAVALNLAALSLASLAESATAHAKHSNSSRGGARINWGGTEPGRDGCEGKKCKGKKVEKTQKTSTLSKKKKHLSLLHSLPFFHLSFFSTPKTQQKTLPAFSLNTLRALQTHSHTRKKKEKRENASLSLSRTLRRSGFVCAASL